MTYATWDWMYDINIGGVVNGIQTFLPRMLARGDGGHVVNTASIAGIATLSPGYLYNSSKAAVIALTESLRAELDDTGSGIGMSVLCPGPVATGIMSRSLTTRPDVVSDQARAQVAQLDRMLSSGTTPDTVGELVHDAIVEDRLYVFTDRLVADGLDQRSTALLAALPPA
jgi:NADP-dependent 3-hydroxy acid dehydrogenase YdfG